MADTKMLARPISGPCTLRASVVNEEFLASAVNLAHRALQAFGKLAIVLAKLRVAPGLEGQVRTVLIADLGAVFLPQQHERHALAAQLLVKPPEVGLRISLVGARRRQQASLQRGFVQG